MDGKTHEAKQLVVERVKQHTNILVTVENNPSVDELAAALAFTLMLNKMDKHATAVFSGVIPAAINFLEPNKTFEHTADSLRDFIIALDKDKADRLRYKVEDDLVKIFITPYQSKITEKDLQFSQGEFNVELVVALGVKSKDALDRAIAAHGRILHDATIITVNARGETSSLGAINWQDNHASSISEMLASLSESLEPKLLDGQMSTALLTGIVSATERFSNDHTTPHTMTIAAELMAAGANQQLIATNLQASAPKTVNRAAEGRINSRHKIEHDAHPAHEGAILSQSRKVLKNPPKDDADEEEIRGEMKVRHEHDAPQESGLAKTPAPQAQPAQPTPQPKVMPVTPAPQPASQPAQQTAAVPTIADELENLTKALNVAADTPPAAAAPAVTSMPATPTPAPAVMTPQSAPAPLPNPFQQAPAPLADDFPKITPIGQRLASDRPGFEPLEPPTLGGTLNATSAEAEEDSRKAALEAQQHNNVTLNHGALGGAAQPVSGAAAPVAPMASQVTPVTPVNAAAIVPTEDDLEAARRAVNDALNGLGNPAPAAPTAQQAPTSMPNVAPQQPSALPPMPDFSTLPPMPPMPNAPMGSAPAPMPAVPQAPLAPTQGAPDQFRIPGQ